MPSPSYNIRDQWLAPLLEEIAQGGRWDDVTLQKAAKKAELSSGEQALAAPNGPVDLIDHFFDRAESQTRDAVDPEILETQRTEPRITAIIMTWFGALEPHQEAVRQAIFFGIRPWKSAAGLKRLWSVANFIWQLAGDNSTDFNHYSKRGLLSSALPSIILYWLKSPANTDLEAYIETRLKRRAQLGKSASKLMPPWLNRQTPTPKNN